MPTQSGKPFSFSAAALSLICGLFAADLALVLASNPPLFRTENWQGLFALSISGMVLYLAFGISLLAFSVLVAGLGRLMGRRVSGLALALIAAAGMPAFLVVQYFLQARLWGWIVSPASIWFYVPSLSGLLLVAALVLLLSRPLARLSAALTASFRARCLLALAAGLSLAGCWLAMGERINVSSVFSEQEKRNPRAELSPEQRRAPSPDAPNFIILTIECLRSQDFGPQNAPFIWQLAQQNVYFSRYYAAAPATRASTTSLFTSLFPAQHQSYNVAALGADGATTQRVSNSILSFPRIFQAHGYRTVMVTSNGLTADSAFGFDKVLVNFDSLAPYDFAIPYLQPFQGFQFLWESLRFARVLKRMVVFSPQHSQTYFDAARVNQAVFDELDDLGQSPFLMYVHYMEPHAPYYNHPYRPIQFNLYSRWQLDSLKQAYLSEVSVADRAVESLFQELGRSGLLSNSYILITSDHGEEFLDHGNWGHGKSLYPEVLHVPAILVAPRQASLKRQVDDVVQSVDIGPTLADLAGLPSDPDWEGASLRPLLREGSQASDGIHADGTQPGRSSAAGPRAAFAQFQDRDRFMASAATERWLIILNEEQAAREILLFNLKQDPYARMNLFDAGFPDEQSEMLRLLVDKLAWLKKTASKYSPEVMRVDPQHLKQLRTLGYVE